MKNWIKQIFKHGFLIAVVIGISIGYAYREQLFPMFFDADDSTAVSTQADSTAGQSEQTPAGDAEQASVSESKQQTAKIEEPTGNQQNTQTSDAQAEQKVTEGTQPADPAMPASQTEVKKPAQASTEPAKIETAKAETAKPGSVQSAPAEPVQSKATEVKPGQQLAEMPGPPVVNRQPAPHPAMPAGPRPPIVTQPRSPSSMMQRMPQRPPVDQQAMQQRREQMQKYMSAISQARQAYWQGQHKQAIEQYQQANKQMPDRPDAYGELGNLYYSQGEWKQAGEQYYQCALRLLKMKRYGQAGQLAGLVRGLNPERAKELDKQLQEATQR